MKKIILNTCFGGYGWSRAAILDYLDRIGATLEFKLRTGFADYVPSTKEAYLKGNYGVSVFANGKWIHSIDREDPVAIQLLEESGSEYCSGNNANLVIEEYDDALFKPIVDEYDGAESLELYPCIAESRIRECSTMDEVVDLLKQVNIVKTA